METVNELDKLRKMLKDAGIPYESTVQFWLPKMAPPQLFPADQYMKNQIVYGRYQDERLECSLWKFDAILQFGSHDRDLGLLETWGDLGTDEHGEPMTMSARRAFAIISCDWEKTKERNPKHDRREIQ